jgi:hypothetical protein
MSVLVLKDVQVLLGPCAGGNDCLSGLPAYDVSQWVTSVTLSTTHDLFETTQVNDTAKKRVPGLADNIVTVEFNQDFGSGITDLEYVMNQPGASSLIGTIGRMLIRPNNAATSAGNPQYYFEVVFSEWQPLSGRVGDISTVQVTWPVNGVINKSYS